MDKSKKRKVAEENRDFNSALIQINLLSLLTMQAYLYA